MGTNTGIGIGIGIPFKNNALGGDRPYLPPELKAKLIGVWDNYGKKNTDADRNIIKNKIPNAGGDLEILNAAYEGMSGYNGYPVVFGANKTWRYKAHGGGSSYIYTINDNKYNFTQIYTVAAWAYSYIKQNGELTDYNKDVTSFKIKVTGLEPDKFIIKYNYLSSTDATVTSGIVINSDGIYELPKSFANDGSLIDNYGWIGFGFAKMSTDIPNTITGVNVTIEVLPEHEGAFVTDGVDDMIVSQNPVSEMLDGSKELTVVSMIHQISPVPDSYGFTNYIREGSIWSRTNVKTSGKTGIYGYKISKGNTEMGASNLINNILGDKADYEAMGYNITNYSDINYSVAGYIKDGSPTEVSSVAWYWTFIAKRALTTDEINQVIAYYNLDKYVKPDIYYDVKKQGLTNDNHAQFGDKLIDYSGNSRDLQLFNIGWNPGSGIGKYVTNFGIWSKDAESKISCNSYSFTVNGSLKRTWLMWYVSELPSFKIKVSGINSNGYVDYGYYDNGSLKNFRLDKDGIHTLPPLGASSNGHGFKVNDTSLDWTGLVIEQIPDFAGALCFDGVNDFGQFVGDLGLKDYTVIFDRAYPIVTVPQFSVISEATGENANTPFLLEHINEGEFAYSYLANTAISINKEREICYQSTYQYKDTAINRGSSTSLGTGLTIARYGINSGYSALALYSFMLFHYSMSKFLIERQLKKHKLGTLYPSMVEFRPIIKSNIDIKNIVYLDKDSNVVKVGDYISIGSNIKTSITVLDGYKISKVSSIAFNNITIEKSNTDFIYDVIFYGIKKSPQKINLVIEQDSDYVQWNPNIKANVSKYSVTANIRKTDGTTLKLVNGQFYSTSITGNLVFDIVPPYKDSDEVTNVVIDGKSYVPTKDSSGNFYRLEIPLVFPKEINITIQEYVRYEDIVQPYPVLLRFKDENNNEISWGDKIKLGSSITRIGSFNDCNLLKDIYTVSNAKLNGSPLPNTLHVVERQMVFTCTATWDFDNNEPKCILSPRLLRIPNSSYKILGYIPDISGHGNHGKINNSAYAEGSGVNADGSYQFDGVDDFVTIPTTVGGKQVLMKVNWQSIAGTAILYDQRTNGGFAIFNRDFDTNENKVPAYRARNIGGSTYIDGILNKYIYASELKNITHNIVELHDPKLNIGTLNPKIGSSYLNSSYTQMSLYDFMLFDNISTEDKIKELNEYVGIEAKVELPPYYWDAYGKTNLDADKTTIQQRGVAVGDYDLTNYNHAYEGMSGYNGYPVVLGANKTWETSNTVNYIYDINSTIVHITNVKHANNALLYSYVKRNGALANIKEIPAFRLTVKGLEKNSKLVYKYLATENATKESTVYLGNGIHKLPKSFVPTDALLDLTTNSLIGFAITPMIEGELVFDCDITIEILPEYENGLVYDGVSDFTDNKNIPIFTDFTAIIKRVDLDAKNDNSTVMFKGNKIYESSIGNGFILDYCYNSKNYVYSYGKLNQIERDDSKIIYLTPESYNGNPIIKGENEDNLGLVLGKYWKGVIYKTILYSKTISLLEINFLKNLMEKDEIIDINHPIFISNTENESNTSQDT